MSDLDFDAALAAKVTALDEAEATITEETPAEAENVVEEVVAEPEAEVPEEQPRDEKGRFVPKFKSHEEAEKAYENIQSLVGRQGQELGELRSLVETQLNQPKAPPAHGELQSALEENPKSVALWAVQNENGEVLDQAINAWYEKANMEDDPRILREVSQFERALEMAQFRHEFSSEIQPTLADVKSESEKRALTLAQRDLRVKYPDLDDVLQSATTEELEGLDEEYIGQLKERDPKRAIETIYRWVSVERRNAEAAATEERKALTTEEKRQAVVANSSSSPVEGAKSGKEALKEYFLTPEPHSVHHGLVRE